MSCIYRREKEGGYRQIHKITGDVTHYSVNTIGSSDIFAKSKVQTAEVAVDIRIINVRTGEITLSETGRGKAEKKFGRVLGMGSEGVKCWDIKKLFQKLDSKGKSKCSIISTFFYQQS
ncbi:MAG: hypothetical protein HY754_08190, partial [Nitrospirae bacterium]|nr:hypothetical protein [Nitrospirota bacterium]